MSTSSDDLPNTKRYPLHIHISITFTALILLSLTTLGLINYWQTKSSLIQSTNAVFENINTETRAQINQLHLMSSEVVTYLSNSYLADGDSLAARMKVLPMLLDALEMNPDIDALFAGYGNGDFFLFRRIDTAEKMTFFNAPRGTAYLIQSISSEKGTHFGEYIFLDGNLAVLDKRPEPNYTYDPRTREWYKSAMATDSATRTQLYIFHTTQAIGQTAAIRAGKTSTVIGADLTISKFATFLEKLKPTPSSVIILFTDSGQTIFYSGIQSTVRKIADGKLDILTLDEIGTALAREIIAKHKAHDYDEPFVFAQDDNNTLAMISRLGGKDAVGIDYYMAIATPERDILPDTRELITRQLSLTFIVLLIAVPISWYFSRRISRDLRDLIKVAQNLRKFDFSEKIKVASPIQEVQDLSDNMTRTDRTIRQFLEITSALSSERDFTKLLGIVLKETMGTIDAQAGVLYLISDSGDELIPEAVRYKHGEDGTGDTLTRVREMVSEIPSLSMANAVKNQGIREALAGIPQTSRVSDSDWPSDRLRRIVDARQMQMIAVPLKNNDGVVIGVMCLYRHDEYGAPNQDMLSFVTQLSGGAAISIENHRLLIAQKKLLDSLIKLIAGAIDSKSHYTGGHCQRVPAIAKLLTTAANETQTGPLAGFHLDSDGWDTMRIAAWLHDCGKVTTPEYVVDKATKLETIYNRIHEIRTRFEVLKRDAEIEYWRALAAGGDKEKLELELADKLKKLDDDFAFVAECNIGDEAMGADKIDRLRAISRQTWKRTLSDRLGLSWEEKKRKSSEPEESLPAVEHILADKPDHLIDWEPHEIIHPENAWGIKVKTPPHKYNLGEITNLSVIRGTLTEEERYKINDHIVQTIIMLSYLPFPSYLKNVPNIACSHHERMDGRGYPRGLKKEDMSIEARILCISDVFEALTAADRPYKKAKTLSESLALMAKMVVGNHLDKDLFEVFIRSGVYREYAEKFMNGEQIDFVDEDALLAEISKKMEEEAKRLSGSHSRRS